GTCYKYNFFFFSSRRRHTRFSRDWSQTCALPIYNLVIDHFRKNNRMPKFENNDDFNIFSVLSDNALNIEKQIIKGQVEDDVRRLIQELPEDQKEVLIMRIYKDMSFKEIRSEERRVGKSVDLGGRQS